MLRPDGSANPPSRPSRRRRGPVPVALAAVSALAAFLLIEPASAAPDGGTEPLTIAIDVGHSQARAGATSARGRPEFEFNRDLALVVDRELRRQGFHTRLIGADGRMDRLTDRTAQASAAGADFFLSLHHDSVQPQYLETWQTGGREQRYSDRFSGYSLFVSRKNPAPQQSEACAAAIGRQLRQRGFTPSYHHAEPIAGENRPLADAPNGVYYFDDLVVLKTAPVPAVLVEAGIILNRDDELALSQPSTRERLAGAIGEGLLACLARHR